MKRLFSLLAAAMIITFMTTAMASAQMGKMDDQKMADTTKMTGKSEMMSQTDMMKKMSGNSQMMSEEMAKLQQHFNEMMNINDMTMLKTEMKKHQEMMTAMQEKMTKNQGMCKKMMSMMQGPEETKPGTPKEGTKK